MYIEICFPWDPLEALLLAAEHGHSDAPWDGNVMTGLDGR